MLQFQALATLSIDIEHDYRSYSNTQPVLIDIRIPPVPLKTPVQLNTLMLNTAVPAQLNCYCQPRAPVLQQLRFQLHFLSLITHLVLSIENQIQYL
jgi:hypothetical protein